MYFHIRLLFLVLLSVTCGWAHAQQGPSVEQPHVSARLVADTTQLTPGQTFYLGVEYTMEEAWHIYWKNPGDTGIPTEIHWELPEGFTAGPIQWPVPHTYLIGGLMNYVHEEQVILMAEVTAPDNLPESQTLTFKARSDWLICKDICVPGGADLELSLPTTSSNQPAAALPASLAKAFSDNRAHWPTSATDAGLEVSAWYQNNEVRLVISGDSEAFYALSTENLYFFEDNTLSVDSDGYPLSPNIDSNAPQPVTQDGSTFTLTLKKSDYGAEIVEEIGGVLKTPSGGLYFQTEVQAGMPTSAGSAATASAPIASTLLYAFLGGLILNLMPCVFPVIGIKIMGFVNQAGEARGKIIAHGITFTLGVLISFWVLAGIFIAVRAGGETLGWGFQFENPATLYVLAIVFLIFAMNMSGIFEFGTSAMSLGQGAAQKSGLAGTFFSGVLATIVSTPCSGPFLGTALGAVLTLPNFSTWLVFTFIAIGLSTPYLLLSAFPKAINMLPRPGAWMETFKQGMAFLLYGAAAVMLSFYAGTVIKNESMGSNTHLLATLALVIVALGVWVYGRWSAPHRSKKSKWAGGIIAATLVFGGSWLGFPRESELVWETWSPARVAEAQAAGDTVYVDFTASWCATCQTNKIFAVNRKPVVERILKDDVVLLKADWTDFDPEITAELARFQRNAVPFNLVYGPAIDEPLILPEALTPDIILDALDNAQSQP